tara:strand:+ start:4027 stop:4848 length:822 start_codon:yes stop_codon:yes gene_type:complete
MKKLIYLMVLTMCFQTFAQRKPKIKGNRSVVEVQNDLPPFNAIELNDDLDIVLKKSQQAGYSIEADDNLVDVLKFKVEGSTLFISSYYKITAKKKLEITVFYEELMSIVMREGGIKAEDNITSDVFDINLYETSRLEINLNAGLLNLNMEGISAGDLNLAVDSLNITLKDRSDVRIYAVSRQGVINMYKGTSAKLEGMADDFTINLYENANLKAEKLEAKRVVATLQDSPNANIYAKEEFYLASSGSSKTHLYGDAKITLTSFLDSSQLHKEK